MKNNKGFFNPLWLLLVVAAVLLVAGVVFYSQNQKSPVSPQTKQSVSEINNLNTQLNNLDDGTSDTDLNALEKDLQTL